MAYPQHHVGPQQQMAYGQAPPGYGGGPQVVNVAPAYPQQQHYAPGGGAQKAVVATAVPMGGDVGKDGGYLAFQDRQVRLGFVKKVYGILTVQLLVTLAVVCYFTFSDAAGDWVRRNPNVYNAALALSFVTLIALACCSGVRRSYPMNYITLGVFTAVEAYMLGCVAATYTTESVVVALAATVCVSGSLMAYAHTTKSDFTQMGGMLMGGVVTLVVMFIFFLLFPSRIGMVLLGGLAALLFCGFIVYDVQIMIGGRHKKYQVSPDEYVFCALSLYIDVINLFSLILCMSGDRRD
mmetsp:Transcript_4975/g.18002  ORF Transcript_4975/g.18002 Transcript_4975/m.18002 type:complete len:294 (-) Transcript_4975:144-1025(-)